MNKQSLLFMALSLIFMTSLAQQKMIGFRHNDYINNTWIGIDSMLFDYNSGGDTLWHFAIKGDSNNGWKNNFRYTFQWDANHHRTYQLREKSNGAGGWVNDNQYNYIYDGSGNLTEVIYQIWSGGWQNNGHLTFTGYNSFGKPSNILTESWNGAAWSPVASNDKSYVNSQYQLQYDSYFYWDQMSASWVKINRKYYTYLQDSISSIQVSLPDSLGNWKSSTKEVRSYNLSNMLMTYKTNQVYDTAQNLQDVNRYKYTYSGTNKISLVEYQLPSGSLWNSTNKTTYVYDTNDSLSMQFSELYTGVWENDQRTDYYYTQGNLTGEQHYIGNGSIWVESYQVANSFDANNKKTYALWSNYNGSTYNPAREEFYYYNTYPLSVSSLEESHYSIYPNPTKDELMIDYTGKESRMLSLTLSDMQGRKRMSVIQPIQNGKNTIQLSLKNLEVGSYILSDGIIGRVVEVKR